MTRFFEPALQPWQNSVPHLYFVGQIHPPKRLINAITCTKNCHQKQPKISYCTNL